MDTDSFIVPDSKCFLQLRGERPFYSDKYDITKHPNYGYLSDADPKLAYDDRKELVRRFTFNDARTTDVYDLGLIISDHE